ncbi:MAG: SEC-C domain-containing protein [Candidatus Omnitrophica bacterium]|jgi:hypothetical protein|nr:SEC-C domain-containing protein [Candidatus Omnitrophota bacterium]
MEKQKHLVFYPATLGHGVLNVCWFRRNEQFYSREAHSVTEHFPKLIFYTRGEDILVLKGDIEIKDGADILDVYQIEIKFPKSYPRDIPILIEVGGRIPRIANRHVNDKTGICCIGPRLEQRQKWLKDSRIYVYITDFVLPFLANQSYYERVGDWKNGQYDHGAKGILTYYSEAFGISDRNLLELFLQSLSENQRFGRNDLCLCGSSKKAKKCHLDLFDKLRTNGCPELFKEDLENLKKDTKAQGERSSSAGVEKIQAGDIL